MDKGLMYLWVLQALSDAYIDKGSKLSKNIDLLFQYKFLPYRENIKKFNFMKGKEEILGTEFNKFIKNFSPAFESILLDMYLIAGIITEKYVSKYDLRMLEYMNNISKSIESDAKFSFRYINVSESIIEFLENLEVK
jgi:hypothetical protein